MRNDELESNPYDGTSVRRDPIAALLLAATIIVVTSFDYIWYGPLPLWLIFVIGGVLIGMIHTRHRPAIGNVLSETFLWIVLPWLCFVVAVAAIDIIKGHFGANFSKRVLLNVAALALLVMVCAWTSRIRPRTVIYLLAIIGTLQGLLCIAQYYRIEAAWELPNAVMKIVGARYDKEAVPILDFASVQRVRGSNLFVHKFNPMQGMLAAFLLTVMVLNVQNGNRLQLHVWFLLPAVAITFIGMFLTFSRSTIYGLGFVLVIILANTRRFVTVAIFGAVLGMGYLVYEEMQLGEAREINRIADFTESRVTNASRVQQYKYAFSIFADEPIIGGSTKSGSDRLLVHSVLLRLLMDYGVLGTLPYLWVLMGVVRLLWVRGKHGGSTSRVIALAGLCSFAVGIVDAWTHSSGLLVRDINQAGMIGLFLGLVMLRRRCIKHRPLVTATFAGPRRSTVA